MWLILYMRSVVYQTRNARWSIGKKTEKCSRILIMPDDARTHAGLHIGEHGTWLLLLLRQTMMRRLLKSCKRRCRVSESEWAANISSHTDRFMSSVRRLLVYIRLNTVSALMLYVCKVEHRSCVGKLFYHRARSPEQDTQGSIKTTLPKIGASDLCDGTRTPLLQPHAYRVSPIGAHAVSVEAVMTSARVPSISSAAFMDS
jgi:hypothetical protein